MSEQLFETITRENESSTLKRGFNRIKSRMTNSITATQMIKNMSFEEIMLYRRPSDGYSVFHLVAERRDFSLLKLILEKYKESSTAQQVNMFNNKGETPLRVLLEIYGGPRVSDNVKYRWCKKFLKSANSVEKFYQTLSCGKHENASTSLIDYIRSHYPKIMNKVFDKVEFFNIPISLTPCLSARNDNPLLVNFFHDDDLFDRILKYIKKHKYQEDIDSLCFVKPKSRSILHLAIRDSEISKIFDIIDVVKETKAHRLFFAVDGFGYNALLYAVSSRMTAVVVAILSVLNYEEKRDLINHCMLYTIPPLHQEHPIYRAFRNEDAESAWVLLDTKCCFLNSLESSSLFRFMRNDSKLQNKLRSLGCLEEKTHDRAKQKTAEGRLEQDKQGIHASYTETTIEESLQKLKSNIKFNLEEQYRQFVNYCNDGNCEFISDMQALKLDSETFSLRSIREGLSELSTSERTSFFSRLINERLAGISNNSQEFQIKFKERIALLWGNIMSDDSHIYKKFHILKEGDSAEKRQKLRNILFACIIQTRFEYDDVCYQEKQDSILPNESLDPLDKGKGKADENSKVKFELLLRSDPSCAFGFLNYLIEAFSDRHDDIIVREVKASIDVTNHVARENQINLNSLVRKAYMTDERLFSQVIDGLRLYGDDANALTEADIVQYCTIGQIQDSNCNIRLDQTLLVGRFLGALKNTASDFEVNLHPGLVRDVTNGTGRLVDFYVLIEEALQKLTKNELITILLNAQKEYLLHQLTTGKLDKEIGQMDKYSDLYIFIKTQFENTNLQNESWYLNLTKNSRKNLDGLLNHTMTTVPNQYLPSSSIAHKRYEAISRAVSSESETGYLLLKRYKR